MQGNQFMAKAGILGSSMTLLLLKYYIKLHGAVVNLGVIFLSDDIHPTWRRILHLMTLKEKKEQFLSVFDQNHVVTT